MVPTAAPGSRPRIERLFAPSSPSWSAGRAGASSYARRRMDSGDLVQEAVLRALRRAGELDQLNPETLRSYLQTSILNRIRDEIRRSRQGEVRNGPLPARPDPGRGPLDDAIESEDRRKYRSALLALCEEDRMLLIGRVDLGMTYEELALVTRRPTPEAARAAARRAALRLARRLGEMEDDARRGTATSGEDD